MQDNTASKSGRFLTVDSLRGLAALSVAIYHLYVPSFSGLSDPLTRALSAVFHFGYLGVAIFFVISGFVIASTINTAEVTFGFVGKYIIKRVIRLDPPYWLSIIVDIALIWATIHVFHLKQEIPSVQKIAAHLVYMQDFLGYGGISAIYWTLCMEVQFYIFFTVVFAVYNYLNGRALSPVTARYSLIAVFVSTTAFSILIMSGVVDNPLPGIFLPLWYLFVAGATCYWTAISRQLPSKYFFLLLAIMAILLIAQIADGRETANTTIVGLITAGFLYFAAIKGKLSSWLGWRPLLYLGTISYSLYLFHGIIGERFISFMRDWFLPWSGFHMAPSLHAFFLFLGSLLCSVVAAHLVYRCVERPALQIAKKIRPGSPVSLKAQLFGQGYAAKNLASEG